MARLSRINSSRTRVRVFSSPADALKPPARKSMSAKSSEAPSPLGYTVCRVCEHVVGLKKSTFSDKEATPPIKENHPVLARHSSDGYRSSRRYSEGVCVGSETAPTNPVFQNQREA